MSGIAKTNKFMLASATVMIGATEDLYDLNPVDHSIGLVKNFSMTSEPGYVELTQGVKGDIVDSVMTSNPVRATMEVYEYTAKNLSYGLGIEGASNVVSQTVNTTVDGVVAASPASNTLDVDDATGLSVGDRIMIKVDDIDNFVIRKITSISTNTIEVDQNLPAIPDAAEVHKINAIDVGSKSDQPYYAAKIAGKFSNNEEVVIHIPKLRIMRGFNMAFSTEDYGNLPFEFTLYDLVATDTFYNDFKNRKAEILTK